MRKSGKDSGTFGAPKPLPGQPGYNVTETQILEKETKEMEAQLQYLQDRNKQQQLESEKVPSTGSTKWKSSRPEKGSIRAYGKEVTEKHKTKTSTMGTDQLLGSSTREKKLSSVSRMEDPPLKNTVTDNGNFTTKDVDAWTCDDVGDWLNYLELPQYVPVFLQNEINGGVLLDLTLDDLDYLSVTVLAHRKTILRAIEEIRLNQKPSNKATPRLMPGIVRSQSASRINVQGEVKSAELAEPKKSLHWSQLEPIASKQVKGGSMSVNPADEDILDEEAEREAFKKAVEEWRNGSSSSSDNKKVVAVKEKEGKSVSDGVGTDSTMWVNPFASVPQQAGGNLRSGALDEEQEHVEFVKAVEAWRNQKTSSNTNSKTPHVTKENMNINKNASSESVMVGSLSPTMHSARMMADALAKQMEEEQQQMVSRIEKQKQDAKLRLAEANKELQKLRMEKEERKAHEIPTTNSRSINEEMNAKYTYAKSPRIPEIDFTDSDNEESMEKVRASVVRPSTVKIDLVESTLGVLDIPDSEGCIVEYESDEN